MCIKLKNIIKKRDCGQMLIEILVAMGTAVVIISAITVTVISALNNAQFSKNQNLATQYAQQGMEVVRKIRDSDWSLFSSYSTGDYCLDKGSTVLRQMVLVDCGQNVDTFVRQIDIEKSSSDCSNSQTKITVSVSWSDSKCTTGDNLYCHSIQLVSCLSDVKVVPSP